MAQIKTTAQSREFLEELRRRSLGRPNMWARAALGFSLGIEAEPEMGPYDNNGTEFKFGTLLGEDEEVFTALLIERAEHGLNEEEITPLIKAHVERGLRLLREDFNRLNKKGDELMLTLLRSRTDVASSASFHRELAPIDIRSDGSFAVDITIGTDPVTGQSINHRINKPGQAPHIAIMGKNGTGKTRLALSLLGQLRAATGRKLGMLIFDYAKGDIAGNKDFLRSIQGVACSLPTAQLPFDPLAVPDQESSAVQLAARRFRDTLSSVVHLGAVQRSRCLDLLVQLYQDYRPDTPTLENLVHHTELMYSQNNWKADSLTSIIRDCGAFPLFTPAHDGSTLLDQTLVLDIHELPHDLRKLGTFLILDRLYWEIMNLDDSPLDSEGNRQLRFVIAIDEAHHFLPCKQATLEKMIREVRSKGVVVMLMSQSPDDFDQPSYNFAREMGLSFVFSCFIDHPKMLDSLLGSPVEVSRVLQLGPGLALTRTQTANGAVEIRAW